ncbi:MAG: VTT domain-containing protein [Clostridiales bacterium]|jgi:uncharacterized membrane protein YdjX (TVP38/TMEM64 family)|nr:VTT domain-containing protein [Clostridiales bacterium]
MKRSILKRKVEKRDIISIAAVALFLVLLVFITVQYVANFGGFSGGIDTAAENMKDMIQSYGSAGIIIFILMHALQVVVAAIPAAAVQFVGGVIYGTVWGVLMSELGILAGSLISFHISRIFGKRIVSLFVKVETLEKIESKVAGSASSLVLLGLFIMPGFPKDFLPWVFGLTKFNTVRFHIISAVGRLPAMLVATYMGAHIIEGDPTMLIVVTAVSIIIFALLYIFRNKLFSLIGRKTNAKRNEKSEN